MRYKKYSSNPENEERKMKNEKTPLYPAAPPCYEKKRLKQSIKDSLCNIDTPVLLNKERSILHERHVHVYEKKKKKK